MVIPIAQPAKGALTKLCVEQRTVCYETQCRATHRLLRNSMSNTHGGTTHVPAAQRRHVKARHGSAGVAGSSLPVRCSGRHEFRNSLQRAGVHLSRCAVQQKVTAGRIFLPKTTCSPPAASSPPSTL